MKPIYVKYNRERLEKYQIKTILQHDSDGCKEVLKQALKPEAGPHIDSIYNNYLMFKEKYTHAYLALCEKRKDALVIQFVEGQTLETKLLDLLVNKKFASFYNLLDDYKTYLESFASQINCEQNIINSDDSLYSAFVALDTKHMKCMELANIDLSFDNIVIDNNNNYIIIDFEWILHRPIPINFIFFRAIYNFHIRNNNYLDQYLFKTICKQIGIDESELDNYIKIEKLFQDQVSDMSEQKYENNYLKAKLELSSLVEAKEIEQKNHELNLITNSLSWKVTKPLRQIKLLLAKYQAPRRNFKEARIYCHNLINDFQVKVRMSIVKITYSFRTLSYYFKKGFRILFTNPKRFLSIICKKRSKTYLHSIILPEFNISMTKDSCCGETTKAINKKVSIVVPTKNAGEDFAEILEKIKNQKGVCNFEIIVIDSGSTDDTVNLAMASGCKVHTIPSEEFNHGLTRNCGADHAEGDYILFTVQDALPIGDRWLYNMVKPLEDDEEIAAVTCRQVPRYDADLFSGFSLWYHYTHTMALIEDRVVSKNEFWENLSANDKRALVGLDNVSCCVRSGIFEKYKFLKIKSSEDLELGNRLLSNNHKLAFLNSTGVIHSHDRGPAYFFNRSYVDTKTINTIFTSDGNNNRDKNENSLFELIGSINHCYVAIKKTKSAMLDEPLNGRPTEILENVKKLLHRSLFEQTTHNILDRKVSGPLDDVLDTINKCFGGRDFSDRLRIDLIYNQYNWILDKYSLYISNYNSFDNLKDDFFLSLYKLYAIIAGSAIANCCIINNPSINEVSAFTLVDNILSEGV